MCVYVSVFCVCIFTMANKIKYLQCMFGTLDAFSLSVCLYESLSPTRINTPPLHDLYMYRHLYIYVCVFVCTTFVFVTRSGYDLTTLTTSTWLVYGFAAGAPLLLWVVLNQLDVSVSLIKASFFFFFFCCFPCHHAPSGSRFVWWENTQIYTIYVICTIICMSAPPF